MNTNQPQTGQRVNQVRTVTLSLLACISLAGQLFAATTLPANKPGSPAGTNTSAQSDLVIAKSEFAIPASPKEGRDPFFPDSTRTQVKVDNGKPAKAQPINLVLQGISGTPDKRFALISGNTFLVDEEHYVNVGSTRVNVRCLKITEDSALIDVDGRQQQLKLRPGF